MWNRVAIRGWTRGGACAAALTCIAGGGVVQALRIEEDTKLDFKDVLIRPKRSTLASRSQVSLERTFKFKHSQREWTGTPLIVANMDTVGTFEMAVAMAKYKALVAIHKHYSVDAWKEFAAKHPQVLPYVAVSVGTGAGDVDKLDRILKACPDVTTICLDVANGYSEHFVDAIKQVATCAQAHASDPAKDQFQTRPIKQRLQRGDILAKSAPIQSHLADAPFNLNEVCTNAMALSARVGVHLGTPSCRCERNTLHIRSWRGTL